MKCLQSDIETVFVECNSYNANYNIESTRGMPAYKIIVDDVYNKSDAGTEELAAKEYIPKVEEGEIKSGEHSSLHDVDPERVDSNEAVKSVISKGREQLPITIAAAAKTDKWWNKGLKTVGKGIKTTANFLFIDDARTIISKDATFVERGMSVVSLTPWGKVAKLGKISKLSHVEKSNKKGRKGAFNEAKRDAKIPKSQQPDVVKPENMRYAPHEGGSVIKDRNGKIIKAKEYYYTNQDGKKVIIQDHRSGHIKGNQGPHFNVRPIGESRNGNFDGTKDHYPF